MLTPEAELSFPIAPEPFPSSAALAASIATGTNIEQHRVTSEHEIHPDGIGFIRASVQRMRLKPLWDQLNEASRDSAVIACPLDTPNPGPSTSYIKPSAFRNPAFDVAPEFLAPNSVHPQRLRPRILQSNTRAEGRTVTARHEALMELLKDGPELVLAWIPAIPGEKPEVLNDRIEQIHTQAGNLQIPTPIILLAQVPMPISGIQHGPRFVRPGRLDAWGTSTLQTPLRPRIRDLHGAILQLLGMPLETSSTAPPPPEAPSAATALLKRENLAIYARLPLREQKLREINSNESIALNMIARGEYKSAINWLLAAVEHPERGIRTTIALLIALSMRRSGMNEQALRFSRSVVSSHDSNPTALDTIATEIAAEKPDITVLHDAIVESKLPLFMNEALLLHAFRISGRTLKIDQSLIAKRMQKRLADD